MQILKGERDHDHRICRTRQDAGTIAIIVGTEPAQYARSEPILHAISSGDVMKLVKNTLATQLGVDSDVPMFSGTLVRESYQTCMVSSTRS